MSNHYAWQMAYMLGRAELRQFDPIVAYQCRHNLFDRQVEVEAVPFLERFQLAMMVYSPSCGGLLSGKYQADRPPPPDSRGATNNRFSKYMQNQPMFAVLEQLKQIAAAQNLSVAQLSMLWLLSRP